MASSTRPDRRAVLRAIEEVAVPVAAKCTGRLGGADVFTTANAAAMVNSARLDAGTLGAFGVHP